MRGKRGLIMGVANDRSLAWGIAAACAAQGAELAFTFQGEALERRVRPLADIGRLDPGVALRRRPTRRASTPPSPAVRAALGAGSISWSTPSASPTSSICAAATWTRRAPPSCRRWTSPAIRFTAVRQRAVPMMRPGGSLLTLTYLGAERWMPHYNVMGVAKAALEASVRYLAADLGGAGIRVNAISAGPIKTLAASGIGDFRYILRWNQLNAPMQRNVTIEEVGGAGVYLLSDLSSGVTGEVHHVDCGYHIVGMKNPEAPDIAIVVDWRCRITASATCSASPPGARATGRRSAAWWMAARRGWR